MNKKLLIIFIFLSSINADNFDKSIKIKSKSISESQSIQKSVENLDDKSKMMYEEYKKYLSWLNTQKRYNSQLRELIISQKDEENILKNDIQKIEHTHKNIVPLMQKMIATLEQLIALDIPFLLNEREKRVAKLKANLKRADISVSDKYRQVLEAYQIENDYATTIESYKAKYQNHIVEFLRVGRVGLYYQSLDFKSSGMWDKRTKKFIKLDDSYNSQILKAIKISKKQLTPDLLILPMQKGDK